ncbi:response regulator [Paenibacillus psychroresistens]|uniref:Response regulator n=1 Tax=Paenibacillus psychroresistens TaxID=1778678 RepID=A0A6B8RVZ0_9BACL|nr:response regulator [Paenibacillus psychroresistens]QGQ99613.1 response regulator [Paenibacillus psychroresistens]
MTLKILLVDDENPALGFLKRMLSTYPDLSISGCFNEPLLALEFLITEKVDVIFLDIEMPKINGLEAAARISQLCPDADIVFVTAYSQYAVEAFNLNALDYLLKPLQRNRVDQTINKLLKQAESRQPQAQIQTPLPTEDLQIQCLQQLHLRKANGEPVQLRWRTQKTMEVFAILIHYRHQTLHRSILIELLWPEWEPEKAIAHLHTVIYHLRKVLKEKLPTMHMNYENEGYRLDMGSILIDIEEWERSLHSAPSLHTETIEEHLLLQKAYLGDYLEVPGYLWAEGERQRLRILWQNHAVRLVEFLESNERYSEAINCYNHLQARAPFLEISYLGLMRIHARNQNNKAVKQQYEAMLQLFSQELNIMPSNDVQDWFAQWAVGK